MNTIKRIGGLWALCCVFMVVLPAFPKINGILYAQSNTPSQKFRPGVTNFVLVGEFEYGMDVSPGSTSFIAPDLGLMPLYKQGNFFFESGLGLSFENDGPAFDIGPINLSYQLPNGWLARVGHFDALPYGRFPRTYDSPWINPMATGPVGFEELGAFSDFGAQLQGSGYLGNMRVRGFVSVTNGPGLSTDPGSAGMITEPTVEDNNNAKMIGGRLSVSPFLSSNFSIGVSGYTTGNIGTAGTAYSGVGMHMLSADFNMAPTVSALDGFIRFRGQINEIHVDKANYTDASNTTYTFTNNSTAMFALLAYQPSMSPNSVLRNTMIGFMYSKAKTPAGAQWDLVSTSQYDVGLTYWMNWRTSLKVDYDIQKDATNTLMVHLGFGL